MSRRKKMDEDDLVPHPRYGTKSVPSALNVPEEEVRASYFAYRRETIYPASAILADFGRQNFSTFPRGYYVDILKTCDTCKRRFIFFAREQKHWYETLGFYIDSDCKHCIECRRSSVELRRRFRRYSETVSRDDLDDRALATLTEDAVFLWEAGLLKDEQRLRRIRNLARKRIPKSAAAKAIERVLSR